MGTAMQDFIFILTTVGFFVLGIAYSYACGRL